MKKTLTALATGAVVIAALPMFAAFEAHVVNVTATIENALNVPVSELVFGTVFPQERLDKTFNVSLSQSFQDAPRVDDVDYVIRQKPKCGLPANPQTDPKTYNGFAPIADRNEDGSFICPEGYEPLPLLCPYLSKHEVTTDGVAPNGENDTQTVQTAPFAPNGINAFHGLPGDWTIQDAIAYQVKGQLAKLQQDISDTWNIDLRVPCFEGHCAQDWPAFVQAQSGDQNINPNDYKADPLLEHEVFGCDLWLEVTGISLPPGEGLCSEAIDLMLVMDNSGSIDDGEEASMKTGATSFITALNIAPGESKAGLTSFADGAVLSQALTDVEATILAAIAAPFGTGLTNIEAGILNAQAELVGANGTPEPNVMVLLTDGNPTASDGLSDHETDALNAATAAKAAGTVIYVVGIGGDVNASYLQTLATSNAHYFAAADFDDLEAILVNLTACPVN